MVPKDERRISNLWSKGMGIPSSKKEALLRICRMLPETDMEANLSRV
jgi:hypothetical protein